MGEVAGGRQAKGEGAEGGIERVVRGHATKGGEEDRVGVCPVGDHGDELVLGERAPRFPAVEGVGVVGEEGEAVFGREVLPQDHRGGKAAKRRDDRFFLGGDGGEHGFGAVEDAGFFIAEGSAILGESGETDRDDLRFLVFLARCRRGGLARHHLPAFVGLAGCDVDARRAGLRIPELELREIAAGGILENLQPILDGAGLPVVAVEI